jgi:acetyl-CoA carboxylase carboxyltransferase component
MVSSRCRSLLVCSSHQRRGCSVVCGFARLSGFSVSIISSDCRHSGGVLTASASEKLKRHVELSDTFNVPVVSFVDQPGFAVGLTAEKEGSALLRAVSSVLTL